MCRGKRCWRLLDGYVCLFAIGCWGLVGLPLCSIAISKNADVASWQQGTCHFASEYQPLFECRLGYWSSDCRVTTMADVGGEKCLVTVLFPAPPQSLHPTSAADVGSWRATLELEQTIPCQVDSDCLLAVTQLPDMTWWVVGLILAALCDSVLVALCYGFVESRWCKT